MMIRSKEEKAGIRFMLGIAVMSIVSALTIRTSFFALSFTILAVVTTCMIMYFVKKISDSIFDAMLVRSDKRRLLDVLYIIIIVVITYEFYSNIHP